MKRLILAVALIPAAAGAQYYQKMPDGSFSGPGDKQMPGGYARPDGYPQRMPDGSYANPKAVVPRMPDGSVMVPNGHKQKLPDGSYVDSRGRFCQRLPDGSYYCK